MDSWVCTDSYEQNDAFNKIFNFFVIETPVKGVSNRGISLAKRHIKDYNEVVRIIKSMSEDFEVHWNALTGNEDVEEQLAMNGISRHMDNPIEYAIHRYQKNMKKAESLLYCIRCALAHGSFCIHPYNNEKYYYFENIYKDGRKYILNGRMIIKESTLLSIIDFFDSKIKDAK